VTFVSGKYSRFAYFDQQLDRPDWQSLRVLDFGGNAGNMLHDPSCRIRHENYWSVDVSVDAVILGRTRFPDAHFVFYDRFNPRFNPEGRRGEPIPSLGTFDVIVAYSVVTHLLPPEAEEICGGLRRMLSPQGVLAFTFLDPRWRVGHATPRNIDWRTGGTVDDDAIAHVSVVIDGRLYDAPPEPGACRQYDVLHTQDYIRELFPDATIRSPAFFERQHCAIVRGGHGRSRPGTDEEVR
jgi:methyltransferase family protein